MTDNEHWTSTIEAIEALALAPAAITLLSHGDPVPLSRLAAAAGWSRENVDRALHRLPRVDLDGAGNLTGLGLTLVPTEHRVRIGGRELYTWCATDAILLPLLLHRPVTVTSKCPATAAVITVALAPTGVDEVDPAEAVISELAPPSGCTDVRSAVCDHGHFFAGPEAAASWVRTHPTGHIQPVAEAFDTAHTRLNQLGWTKDGAGS